MNSSWLPGWLHIQPYSARRLANCCQSSPGIFSSSDPLTCTTSSCDERQHEALGPRVDEAEGQLVVVEAPVHGLALEVGERVVHPAHVPLVREAEAAGVDGVGDTGERGRLLGDGEHAGVLGVHDGVELAEEVDRLEVLPAAVAVGHPLARRRGE